MPDSNKTFVLNVIESTIHEVLSRRNAKFSKPRFQGSLKIKNELPAGTHPLALQSPKHLQPEYRGMSQSLKLAKQL